VLLCACSAEKPEFPDYEPEDAPLTIPGRAADPDQEIQAVPAELQLFSELPQETRYYSIPVRGSGPAGGVLIYSSSNGTHKRLIDDDGRFCVDVSLQPGAPNELSFMVTNSAGERSEPVKHTVRSTATGTAPTVQPSEVINLSHELQGQIEANFSRIDGPLDRLVDGETGAHVELNDHPALWDMEWLVLPIHDATAITQIELSSTACGNTPDSYLLLWSADPHPASEPVMPSGYGNILGWPPVLNRGWNEAGKIHIREPLKILPGLIRNPTHIALIPFTGGCNGLFEAGRHYLSEITILGTRVDRQLSDVGPSCAD
jgi:hypothetical protein